jgi:hypothetical protein
VILPRLALAICGIWLTTDAAIPAGRVVPPIKLKNAPRKTIPLTTISRLLARFPQAILPITYNARCIPFTRNKGMAITIPHCVYTRGTRYGASLRRDLCSRVLSLAKTLGVLSFTPLTMLQACAQAVDFKVGHHFGEGHRIKNPITETIMLYNQTRDKIIEKCRNPETGLNCALLQPSP